MQVRIKKFGAQTEEVKKITRAERFGTKAEENGASAKLNERAARFGIETKEAKAASAAAVKTSPDVSKEVLEKRANRFGNVKEEAPKGTDEALNKRKERFGTFAEDVNTIYFCYLFLVVVTKLVSFYLKG